MDAQFHHKGHAFGVAGTFEAPVHLNIPAEPSVSLPSIGGRSAEKRKDVFYQGLLSIGVADCLVTGGLNADETAWEIHMSSVVENLNILDGLITADKITAKLVLTQNLDADQPRISTVDNLFTNLRILGQPVGVGFHLLIRKQFDTYEALAQAAVVGKSARKVPGVPQNQASSEAFRISLVDNVKFDGPGAVSEGHVIRFKDGGELRLAEMLVTSNGRQLTMLEISLESSSRRAHLVLAGGGVGGTVVERPLPSTRARKVTLPLGSAAPGAHAIEDIPLKDLFYKTSSGGISEAAHTTCPQCGYKIVARPEEPRGCTVSNWPSEAELNHDLHYLEGLKVFTASQLLDTRPFELLRSSRIPLENLALYFEAGRHWFRLESDRSRSLLAHSGWSDRALGAISDGMALRLAAMLAGGLAGERVEVAVQMGEVLSLEQVMDMNPRQRLDRRQDHARGSQADLIGALQLGDDHTRIWLSNQFIALLDANQIGLVAGNPAVRDISPTLPFEACIDEGRKRISAAALSSKCEGNGQIVALLDSGVDSSHPDFPSAHIVHKRDYTGKGNIDQHGHGTHLAGVIVSKHSQYQGIAPKSTIWSYRVLDEKGLGFSQKQLVQALQMAVEDAVNDAKLVKQKIVINCSCAVPRSARAWGRDYEQVCKAFDDATSDAIVVVAAGNQGPVARTITAPGGGASVITVGASVGRPDGIHNFVAHYSSRGPAIHGRSKPDIVAPGGLKNLEGDFHKDVSMVSSRINGVWAQDPSSQKPWFVDNDHYGASGTSQATALVSGVCALLLEELARKDKPITHARVAQALKETARPLGFPDSEQGHGLVQADKAMNWF